LYEVIPWSKDADLIYEMGTWVRCYEVSLHAWNNIFFLELASSQGRLLKIYDITSNREVGLCSLIGSYSDFEGIKMLKSFGLMGGNTLFLSLKIWNLG
jgi:hypothetical protein